MTTETHTLTTAEIRAYEVKAHALRAEAMKQGSAAIGAFLKSLPHRISTVLARPAHA